MNDNPISFLPQDTINPAIQNLGATQGAINQQQIGQQEGLRNQFQSLIDASYGNIWANDQKEVAQDWDKLKSDAVNVFKKASELGGPVNQMDYADLMRQHKDLLTKVATAQQYKDDWAKAVTQAALLNQKQQLAPGVMDKLNAMRDNPGSIYNRPVPSSLIQTQLSPDQVDTVEKDALSTMKIARTTSKIMPDGTTETHNYYDPQTIAASLTDKYKMNPEYKQFVDNNGGLPARIAAMQNIYDKNDMTVKPKPNPLASFATGTKANPYPIQFQKEDDGRYHANLGAAVVPYTAQIPVVENGKTVNKDVKGVVQEVIDGNGKRTMKFLWNEKPTGVLKSFVPDKNGAIEIPYDDAIQYNIDGGTAKLNFKSVGGAKPAAKAGSPPKLTGQINPNTLKSGQLYEVNGKTYKWNGSKLVTP